MSDHLHSETATSGCGSCCSQPLAMQPAQGYTPIPKALWLGGVLALLSEAAHWFELGSYWLPLALALVSILLSGLDTYKNGWLALRQLNLNMNALMAIAVTGALLIGQWPEAAMVMFLFTLAELIEVRSMERARHAISDLMQLAPDAVDVQQGDQWFSQPAASVLPGSLVRVKPGERVALDGEIISGESALDQSPITGESLPVNKQPGDPLFAGSINTHATLIYRVTARADESSLARIIHAVEEAQKNRAPTQQFVDRFARYYTPAVFLLALLVALIPPLLLDGSWYDWVYRALVLLVIACPCALVISTPVTLVSGLARAARSGVLVKGGVFLEQAARLQWIALDKTGTLTQGKPAQADVLLLKQQATLDEVQQLAASLANESDHPVSRALAVHAETTGLSFLPVTGFEAIAGQGTSGKINDTRYWLGNQRLMQSLGLLLDNALHQVSTFEKEGYTLVWLADKNQLLACFAVADQVKATSQEAIAQLHQLGIQTAMLSGDQQAAAETIARQVGVDQVHSQLLPQDKLQWVKAGQQQGTVGMVGDGINDAPALAQADIGFAMGVLGSDTALASADIALMDDDLRKLPLLVRLSRKTRSILIQNISLALGIKAIFILLTFTGHANMWMAVFADMGVSLLVVLNGLRLLRWKDAPPGRGN